MPQVYVPTVFENYLMDVELSGGQSVEVGLWDTAGQENYDRLRPLSYPDTDVYAICFAIDSPDSLDNVQEKWAGEIAHFNAQAKRPVFLIGLKKDLRFDAKTIGELLKTSQRPVTEQEVSPICDGATGGGWGGGWVLLIC